MVRNGGFAVLRVFHQRRTVVKFGKESNAEHEATDVMQVRHMPDTGLASLVQVRSDLGGQFNCDSLQQVAHAFVDVGILQAV